LGSPSDIFYMDLLDDQEYHDVFFSSSSGKNFGINRSVLASSSGFWKSVILCLQDSPFNSQDGLAYVTTEFSDQELDVLMRFCKEGFFPTDGESQTSEPSAESNSLFQAFGVDLGRISSTSDGKDVELFKVKPEPIKVKLEPSMDDSFEEPQVKPVLGFPYSHFLQGNGAPIKPSTQNGRKASTKPSKPPFPPPFEFFNANDMGTNWGGNWQEHGGDPMDEDGADGGGLNLPPEVADIIKSVQKRTGEKPRKRPGNDNKQNLPKKPKVICEMPFEDLFCFSTAGSRDLTFPYQCQRCFHGFEDVWSYRQHFLRHDIEQPDANFAWTCFKCLQFSCDSAEKAKRHEKECKVEFDDAMSKFTYFCGFCGEVFQTDKEFTHHLEHVHGQASILVLKIKCPGCGCPGNDTSRERDALCAHKDREGPHHTNFCVQCNREMNSWTEHVAHIRNHHGGKMIYLCGHCGDFRTDDVTAWEEHKKQCAKFRKLSVVCNGKTIVQCNEQGTTCMLCMTPLEEHVIGIRKHLVACHPESLLKCPECDHLSVSNTALICHIRIKHKNIDKKSGTPKVHVCDICERKTPSKNALKNHYLQHHADEKNWPFQCKECGKRFVHKAVMKTHIERDHRGIKKYIHKTSVCEVCGKEVGTKNMKFHVANKHGITTGGADEITCQICKYQCVTAAKLKYHMDKRHTEVTCEECGEVMLAVYLKRHKLQKHTEVHLKPYVCYICNPPKGFVDSHSYNDHNNIHNGEKPYSCDYCTFKCANSSNLAQHLKKNHKVKPMSKGKF